MTSISAKLGRIQILGVILFTVVACIALAAVRVVRSSAAYHVGALGRLTAIGEIADLLSENRIAEAAILFDNSRENEALRVARNRQLDTEIRTLEQHTHTPAEAAGVQGLKAAWAKYRIRQRGWAELVAQGKREAALASFKSDLFELYARADQSADALSEEMARSAELNSERARANAALITVIVLLVTGGGACLAIATFNSVRRGITRPLTSITASLTDLAAGDLRVEVNGSERDDEVGALVRALEVFRMHARQLESAHRQTRAAQAHAEKLARNDVLTGLPNRRMFVEALQRATQDPTSPYAVLLIDLDRFKPINDVYGHEAGDMVLCELADRFTSHRERLGMVARLGGDEFAVVIPTDAGSEDAAKTACLIGDIVSQPIEIAGSRLEVGATIGIALYPKDGTDPSALLRAADLAMYRAKARVAGPYQFFEPSMHDQVQQRAQLDWDLRHALERDEIRPHYQPLVAIESGDLVGFELLARWHHPSRGMVMPDEFIPAADERGLLGELTYSLLRQACADARDWPSHLTLSLNLAPSQLSDPWLATRLQSILTQGGILPSRLEIEVTENALITDLETTKEVLASLQKLGMRISLDDFGTGYSSLYQLRDLRFDKIKIDRSFVSSVAEEGEGQKIVQAMIGLGKSLGLTTTAEGIEDRAQWQNLSDWGCDYGQGYLFGKAMSVRQANQLIEKSQHHNLTQAYGLTQA